MNYLSIKSARNAHWKIDNVRDAIMRSEGRPSDELRSIAGEVETRVDRFGQIRVVGKTGREAYLHYSPDENERHLVFQRLVTGYLLTESSEGRLWTHLSHDREPGNDYLLKQGVPVFDSRFDRPHSYSVQNPLIFGHALIAWVDGVAEKLKLNPGQEGERQRFARKLVSQEIALFSPLK